ncbi:MAG: hypothetical protein AAF762_02365 [Pseudomonadota bacterium]
MNGLFAETDAAGRVVCVWRKDVGDTVARPIRNASKHAADLTHMTCHGASHEAIADWFEREIAARA